MSASSGGTDVDTDALRNYARSCERSAEAVRQPIRSSLDYPSTIPHNAWDGGGMTKFLQLQSALDSMRETYNRTRRVILRRLTLTANDLDGIAETLRESADEYDDADEQTRERLELWP